MLRRLTRRLTDERGLDALERLVLALIVLNTTVVVLGTVDTLSARYGPLFEAIEYLTVVIFTAEFVVRIGVRLACGSADAGRTTHLARLADPHLLIDLLAILPVYIGFASGAREIGSSTMLRVLRLFKLARYFQGVETLLRIVRRKRADLAASVLWTGLLWLLAAVAIYFAESHVQPQAFSSIPEALWWAGTTITTVGYGDVYPVTPVGRLLGVATSLLGVGIAAVPSSILVSGYLEEVGPERTACPHCGRKRDE